MRCQPHGRAAVARDGLGRGITTRRDTGGACRGKGFDPRAGEPVPGAERTQSFRREILGLNGRGRI